LDELIPYTHIHDENEIVYVLRGTLSLRINSSVHTLKKNDIAIVNRLVPHKFFDNNFAKFILLQFKPTGVYENNKSIDIKYLTPFFHSRDFSHFTAPCETPALEEMITVISEIEKKIKEKGIAYELAVESDLVRLLYLMYQAQVFNMKIIESVKQKRNLQQLSTLLKYMESHYDELITLEQACTIAKLDYHYFSRVFKEKTGKTFVEYLSFIRILNAQKLLTETDEPIAFVAQKVGIPNVSYFNRKFKAQNGMTPSQYREINQKEN
jgi:AraC-like DNA-binding protein